MLQMDKQKCAAEILSLINKSEDKTKGIKSIL